MTGQGMEGTLSKLADNTELCGAVNTLEGKDDIQTYLGKFKKLAHAKFRSTRPSARPCTWAIEPQTQIQAEQRKV